MRLLALALVGIAACSSPNVNPSDSCESAMKLSLDHVLRLEVVNSEGRAVGSGSGVVLWYLGDSTVVLTARHMVRSWIGEATKLSYDHGLSSELHVDRELDYAIVSFNGRHGRPVRLSEATATPVLSRAIVTGFTMGLDSPTVSVGHFQPSDDRLVRFSAPIYFGNSGGGLFCYDKDGPIFVGLVFAMGVSDGLPVSHMGFAVPIWRMNLEASLRSSR